MSYIYIVGIGLAVIFILFIVMRIVFDNVGDQD